MSARIVGYNLSWCDQCRNRGADSEHPCPACGRVMGPETRRRHRLAAMHAVEFDPNDPELPAKVARMEAAVAWWKAAEESDQAMEAAEDVDLDYLDREEVYDPLDVSYDDIPLYLLMWADAELRAGNSVVRTPASLIAVRPVAKWRGGIGSSGGFMGRDEFLNLGVPFEFTPSQLAAVEARRQLDQASQPATQETTC